MHLLFHDKVLAQINNYKNNVLKAQADKEIQQIVKEYKYDVMLLQLKKMQQLELAIGKITPLKGQSSIQETLTQQIKHSSGTKTVSYHDCKLLLSDASNSDDLYKAFERLLTGDVVHSPEHSGVF
ncbi:hypothetical protein [Candidatus Tisiphia endosymbiont of Hybos culiciformis]|uniref:hypothetical protein n=1 Tax=Candidatus Tisiphia endosymbiont of Hybos culiciformis TaxID=3139331 RepID=UPI003CCB068B